MTSVLKNFRMHMMCTRLGDLFMRHGITHIDYLSVDTEGVEPMALRTIDYDKVEIDIIGIEENGNRAVLTEILGGHSQKSVRS